MNPRTEEGRKNIALANAQLEYESFAVVGKDGMKRPLRAFVPIVEDKLTLIWNKKPEDRTHEDRKTMGTSKVPALPKAGELKGPVPEEPIKPKILTPDKLKPQVRDAVAKMKIGQEFEMGEEGSRKKYKKVEGGIEEVK